MRWSSNRSFGEGPYSHRPDPLGSRSKCESLQCAFNLLLSTGRCHGRWQQRCCCQLLLIHGANPNVQYGGDWGNPLIWACNEGKWYLASLLLDHAADADAVGHDGKTPLQLACHAGETSIVKALLAKGASTDRHTKGYGSALIAACLGVHKKLAMLLLDHGADINWEGGEYRNASYAASLGGLTDVPELLMEAGAAPKYSADWEILVSKRCKAGCPPDAPDARMNICIRLGFFDESNP